MTTPEQGEKALPSTVEVNYLKTGSYRTYHVDGVFGGPTAHGKIYVELFLERSVTPQVIQYEVTAEGGLGGEIRRTGKQGIIREVEAGLIMDITVAKAFRDWLDEKIKMYEEIAQGEKE